MVADSIAARYSQFLVTGKDTVGALQISADQYSSVSDTVVVHLVLSQCNVHSFWETDADLVFVADPTWHFVVGRNGGVTDGVCSAQ